MPGTIAVERSHSGTHSESHPSYISRQHQTSLAYTNTGKGCRILCHKADDARHDLAAWPTEIKNLRHTTCSKLFNTCTKWLKMVLRPSSLPYTIQQGIWPGRYHSSLARTYWYESMSRTLLTSTASLKLLWTFCLALHNLQIYRSTKETGTLTLVESFGKKFRP